MIIETSGCTRLPDEPVIAHLHAVAVPAYSGTISASGGVAYPLTRTPPPGRTHPLLVSIVMPVMNGMPWLPEAVESVRRQPGPVELIVCDGGSKDGSREWLTAHPDRATQLVFQPDSGQSDAIVRGLERTRGDLLGWLNADDRYRDGALDLARAAFRDHPEASMVSGGCELIDRDGIVIGSIPVPPDGSHQGLLRHPTNLAQPATLFRRDAYLASGGVDLDLHYAMDVDLWLKLARQGDAALIPDHILAQFRVHADAKTSRAPAEMVREDLRVRLRHGLSPFSRTAFTLARAAYVGPLKARARRRISRRRFL